MQPFAWGAETPWRSLSRNSKPIQPVTRARGQDKIRPMFCPVCHAEYRQGFQQCNDCGVNLVASLSGNDFRPPDITGPNDESVVLLWSGVDPRFFSALADRLDKAGIEYDENPAVPQLLNTVRTDRFQIRVRGGDRAAAKKVLGDLGEMGENSEDIPGFDSRARKQSWVDPFGLSRPTIKRIADNDPSKEEPETEYDGEEVPEDFPERFNPEEATVEVWNGADSQMAQLFRECLSNLGIGCVVDTNMGKTQVLVTPAAEKRAREVVREIEEGTPMP